MGPAFIKAETIGSVGRLTLARAGQRNAQNTQMLDELDTIFSAYVNDPTVRVIVLAAEGDHFSAGHDVKEGRVRIKDISVEDRWAYEEAKYFDYCMRIWDSPKPTIAQVQGACVSGGFMLANMCDLVVASDTAFFSDPVVHKLSAAAVEVLIHPWVMGMRQAKEMLFTGQPISASRALEIGMVNRVVPIASLSDETMALATQVASAPPFALRLIKRSLNRTWDIQGLKGSLSAHFDTHQLSHRTDEYAVIARKGVEEILLAEEARRAD